METPALGKGEVMCAGDIHSASGRVLEVRLSPLDDPLSAPLCSGWPVTKMGSEGDAGSQGCMTLGQLLKCKGTMCSQDQNLSLSPLIPSFPPPPPQDREAGPENLAATAITTAPHGPRAQSPAPQAATAGNPRPEAPPHPDHSPEPG